MDFGFFCLKDGCRLLLILKKNYWFSVTSDDIKNSAFVILVNNFMRPSSESKVILAMTACPIDICVEGVKAQ